MLIEKFERYIDEILLHHETINHKLNQIMATQQELIAKVNDLDSQVKQIVADITANGAAAGQADPGLESAVNQLASDIAAIRAIVPTPAPTV